MSHQRFFEIDQATYLSPKLKRGTSYRLAIKWNAPDLSGETKIYTKRVKSSASDDGLQCVWTAPSAGKRLFTRLPAYVSITVQHHSVQVWWVNMSSFIFDCSMDYHTKNIVVDLPARDGRLLLKAAVFSNPAIEARDSIEPPVLPQNPSITIPELLFPADVIDMVKEGIDSIAVKKPTPLVDRTRQLAMSITQISATTSTVSDSFPTLLATLEHIMKIGGIVAEVHPVAAAAWGVVNIVYQIIKSNKALGDGVQVLISEMDHCCKLAETYASKKDYASHNTGKIVQVLLKEVTSSAQLLKRYGQASKQKFSSVKNYFSDLEDKIQSSSETLRQLCSKLSGHASAEMVVEMSKISTEIMNKMGRVSAGVEHLVATEYFQKLEYAKAADNAYHSHAPDSRCLLGTCTEILSAIVSWISGGSQLDSPPAYLSPIVPHKNVMWLCGVAGSGKSSIAMSVADSIGKLSPSLVWGFYQFSNANQAALHPTKLFSTLALQLAAQNKYLSEQLLEIIKKAEPQTLKSLDPQQQLNTFLLPLLKSLETSTSVHQAAIIIDALDEAGNVRGRRDILSVLADLGPNLPANVQILITSRFENDLYRALRPRSEYRILLQMSQIPRTSTENDILLYITHVLKDAFELSSTSYAHQLTKLALKSEESFQWASTACLYIRNEDDGNAGLSAERRLQKVLESQENGLYPLYKTILTSKFGEDPEPMLQTVLGILVVAQEPLSVISYAQLGKSAWPHDLQDHQSEVHRLVRHLASLISGTDGLSSLLIPLHASFTDFLKDKPSSGAYAVDLSASHLLLATGCFEVMQDQEYGLQFDICHLETSFQLNSEVKNLSELIKEHIGKTLEYACQFWPAHVAALEIPSNSVLGSIRTLISTVQLLYWIEVMSLTNKPPLMSLSYLQAQSDKVWNVLHIEGCGINALILDILQFDTETAAWVQQALHFVSFFAIPIGLSAPHIYLSSIPFIPAGSALRPLNNHFQRTMSLTSGKLVTWPSLRMALQNLKP
ncbi:hypothetical protein DL93DRAFT_2121955, partial [Clavulina sp. PMI_390]